MEGLFYSVGEMSVLLGLVERSVYRLKDKIPGYVKIGGRVYFRKTTFLQATIGTKEPVKDKPMFIEDKHGLV